MLVHTELLLADEFRYLNLAGVCVVPGIDLVYRVQPGELTCLSVSEQPFPAWRDWEAKLVPAAWPHLPLDPGWVRPHHPQGSCALWRPRVSLLTQPHPSSHLRYSQLRVFCSHMGCILS